MSKLETGRIVKQGNSLYIPIPVHVRKDSAYSNVGIDKGNLVSVEIVGDTLIIRKATQ